MFFLSWCESRWRVFSFRILSDRSSEHQKPPFFLFLPTEWLSVSALAAAVERDDVVTGWIREGEVTAGDVSHGSLSVDGLIWCNVRHVARGVLIVRLFLFCLLGSPCGIMFSCFCPSGFFFFFFTPLCQCFCFNHLSGSLFSFLSPVLSLPPSLYGRLNGVSVIKSSGPLCVCVCGGGSKRLSNPWSCLATCVVFN